MRKRRLIISVVVLLTLASTTVVVWEVNDWPPPHLIFKHGLPPTGGPTGRTRVIEGIEFVELKPGYFRMGSHFLCEKGDLLGLISSWFGMSWGTAPKHDGSECPTRWVEIGEPFWFGSTEVTNGQYDSFRPGHERFELATDGHPVVFVSMDDAAGFCDWLSRSSGLLVRLPTEVEWEYACRAGSTAEYCFGSDEEDLPEFCWYNANSDIPARRVAKRRPNSWGLHDLHGNVWEICEPGNSHLRTPNEIDNSPDVMILRGGCAGHVPNWCRSAVRWPHLRDTDRGTEEIGFRPVFTLPEDQ